MLKDRVLIGWDLTHHYYRHHLYDHYRYHYDNKNIIKDESSTVGTPYVKIGQKTVISRRFPETPKISGNFQKSLNF